MAYDKTKDPSRGFFTDPKTNRKAAAVTPANADLTVYAKGLYVGGAGDLSIIPVDNADGDPVVLKAVPVGTFIPIQVRQVRSTGTTATFIVALY